MMNEQVVVIGAGVMGRGIAGISAMASYSTVLVDVSAEQLHSAVASIHNNAQKGVDRGKVTSAEQGALSCCLTTSVDLSSAVEGATLVIEAVPESMPLKIELFRSIAQAVSEETIFATNTSSLSIGELASALPVPQRVIGAHFFNPPHIVKLLEIITAESTSGTTLARLKAFGSSLKREMIVVRDSPGFATSRLGLVIGLEAIRMLEEGVASAQDIDRAMELGYRHPMGPLKLTDLVGLDTRLKIAEYLHQALGSEAFRPPALLKEMVAAGKVGKKCGQGFYTW
jgi:3-hydroxybutyryl-CoA dehydrogenase